MVLLSIDIVQLIGAGALCIAQILMMGRFLTLTMLHVGQWQQVAGDEDGRWADSAAALCHFFVFTLHVGSPSTWFSQGDSQN